MSHYYPPGHPFHQPTLERTNSGSLTASWRSGPAGGGNTSDSSLGTLSSCGTFFSDSANSQDRNWRNGRVWTTLSVGSDSEVRGSRGGWSPSSEAPVPGEVVEAGSTLVAAQEPALRKTKQEAPTAELIVVTNDLSLDSPSRLHGCCRLWVTSGPGEQSSITVSELKNPTGLNPENWIDWPRDIGRDWGCRRDSQEVFQFSEPLGSNPQGSISQPCGHHLQLHQQEDRQEWLVVLHSYHWELQEVLHLQLHGTWVPSPEGGGITSDDRRRLQWASPHCTALATASCLGHQTL